jgi:hypothetical protein
MSLVLQSSGGGSVTIAEPTTASDFTQTLPAANGTIVTTESPQSGSVLQVIQGVTNTSTTISGGPTDTTLTATITPKFATSKILIIVSQFVYLYGGGSDSGFQLFILKNGSIVYNNVSHSLYVAGTNAEIITTYPITYLDSPATTSALTYKTQATASAGGTPTFQWSENGSTITLMEIAG